MSELAIIVDWATLAIRWLHIVAGIAWVGSSFYFIALDLGLRKARGMPDGVLGEEWQVHGGGFYHIQKYQKAPPELPEHLTWFKWESYATWLSGAALLMVIYWAEAELYLIDPGKADLAAWQAILISGGSLAIGWLVYDGLCRSPLGRRPGTLMLALFCVLVAVSWLYAQIFTGRAALLHLGAFTATIMSANVFFIIIPNQRKVVAILRRGETPDARYGEVAKLRSTHNNYLTLPVLFLMISIHFPLAFATEFNWLIASLVFLIGACVRHYFNTIHAGRGNPVWTWAASAVLFVIIMWLSTAPIFRTAMEAEARPMTAGEAELARVPGLDGVHEIVSSRCSLCHSREPLWEGIRWAPGGVFLETRADVVRAARAVYLQSAASHAMPPANRTGMEPAERRLIAEWYGRLERARLARLAGF